MNLVNKDIIQRWGFPRYLKDKNIKFIFNNNDLNSDFKNNNIIENLTCDGLGAKFCLYDIENDKILFTMDFIISETGRLLHYEDEKVIRLECLCVIDSEMRNKGIAKYYLEKLIEFGIYNDINKFRLLPNNDDEMFKDLNKNNALTLEQLKEFYIKIFENLGFNYIESKLIEIDPEFMEFKYYKK